MTTTTGQTPSVISAGYEPIPGYRIEKLLGRGGFGEVWQCEAPGGLKKAIKFVFGNMDQDRATRELKSLNRIKCVQHPFLLTLERFDFIDGRLVILTELADGSLEDEFARQRVRGSCGIPRDRLLELLRDVADALDYLHQRHGLLHLDVKPGNLLMVGEHIKVADFGLLKDLKDLECSIVGGLTPVYAPPELFDGRPSLHSDQYSLAVIFQELLTGVRPFSGRTIAQLATQHVHAAPQLTALMAADRPVIARALEKNPDRRFHSCRDFIAALRAAGERTGRAVSSGQPAASLRSSDPAELTVGDTSVGHFPGLYGGPAIKVSDLPSLDVGSQLACDDGVKHALVLGLGGVGVECLSILNDLMEETNGNSPLAVHAMAVDTDPEMMGHVNAMSNFESQSSLKSVYLPLRKAQEYRECQGESLRSISRRWVFNVPRSGQTEGMRPLGRLALVDHAEKIRRAIEDAVQNYAAQNPASQPVVYVVGSIDGGTASGMVLDVIHLLRHTLDENGLEHAKVFPMLATAALRTNGSQTLAAHNSACALGEMRHYVKIANGYPGDAFVGWPSVPAARSPLNEAYLVAARVQDTALPSPAETIAKYIWINSAFAGEILDAAREQVGEQRLEDIASPSLRSMGVARLTLVRAVEKAVHAPMLARQLVLKWIGNAHEDRWSVESFCERHVAKERFSVDSVLESCLGNWSRDRSARIAAMGGWYGVLSAEIRKDPAAFNLALKKLADNTLGQLGERDRTAQWVTIRQAMLSSIAQGDLSLNMAISTLDALITTARGAQADIDAQAKSDPLPCDGAAPAHSEMVILSERWLWRSVCQIATLVYSELLVGLTTTRERLAERLMTLGQSIESIENLLKTEAAPAWDAMEPTWKAAAETQLVSLHGRLAPQILSGPLDQRAPTTPKTNLVDQLLGEATASALQMSSLSANLKSHQDTRTTSTASTGITQSTQSVSASSGLTGSAAVELASTNSASPTVDESTSRETIVAQAMNAVRPLLLDCGGSQRMVLLVGSEAEKNSWEPVVRAAHKGPLTTVLVNATATTLICEAQKIKLNDVRSRILAGIGGREDVLTKLHSRCDITWS